MVPSTQLMAGRGQPGSQIGAVVAVFNHQANRGFAMIARAAVIVEQGLVDGILCL